MSRIEQGRRDRASRLLRACALALTNCLRPAIAGETTDVTPPSPAWSRVESASADAISLDPIHALMTSVVRQRQLSPLRAARLFATVRVAQSEAVDRLAPGNGEVAAALSGSMALSWMLPQEDASRWVVPAMLQVGRAAGVTAETQDQIHAAMLPVLSHVVDDGADARRRPLLKPEARPGTWLRTPPLFAEQPAEPQGAAWKPWCPGSDRLEVAPAVEHGSSQWHEEVRQVLATAATLTADQRAIAQRWHLDAGSITPPGVWNAMATSFLADARQPVAHRHRVLAVLNIAMQDALVAAWRVKFKYWSERPVTAVRRELDPGFEPLLVTPPFPGYVSGHSTVSAAAAAVLSHYFPAQQKTWWTLAREAAVSRLYGGIHFVSDNEQGLALGLQVAQACLAAFEPAGSRPAPRLVTAPVGTPPDFFALPRMRGLPE